MSKISSVSLESIAVIGMSGRYPGSKTLDQYWENLRSGKECISFFSSEELIEEGIDPAIVDNPNYIKARGYYQGTYDFDASFFGYNPREAELIDPQQRAFMECAWEALEDSGYDPFHFPGKISLFGGVATPRQMVQINADPMFLRAVGYLAIVTSNDKDYLATRIGYKFNLRGPCVTVQTACSTSLVSICIACQNLLSYQSDLALAGGAALLLSDKEGYFYEQGGIVSRDGHCRTFDAAAQGTIFSEGVGVVVLKRLEDALADRDNIHAVIRGFGLNNDGSVRVGFSSPGVDGQVQVLSEAIEMAGISPETIGFIECHGTATPMGDLIEITALTKTFRKHTDRKRFCAVGSVKANIGHTETAAGIAGFTKAVLALENKEIPASLHFEKPNPRIDFENSPFFVNSRLLEWKASNEPRRAGVSSFGVGGTNAHVILEEAPPRESFAQSQPHQLLLYSARSAPALKEMTARLTTHLENHPQDQISDVAFTLQTGRALFSHRRMVVCNGREDALRKLAPNNQHRVYEAIQEKQDRPAVFLFPGQGSQRANMGKKLYAAESGFRRCVDECARILEEHMACDIRKVLFSEGAPSAQSSHLLDQTSFTQPALFVIEYALARLLMEWGVTPAAMLGHSVGEYVAACLSGVLSLADVLALIARRGRLMQALPRGAMLAVFLPEDRVLKLLPEQGQLSIAAVNSPSSCVVSGPINPIQELERALKKQGVPVGLLRTSHAFHSQMMDPILQEFRAEVRKRQLNSPTIPYVSNLTGRLISAAECMNPDYWVDHLRHTVRFSEGAAELLKDPSHVLIEVGPGRTLTGLITQHPERTADRTVLATMPHEERDPDEPEFVLTALGRAWLEGVRVDWNEFYRDEPRCRVSLPTYPFQRERYRLPRLTPAEAGSNLDHGQKKTDISNWFYYPSWKRVPRLSSPSVPAQQTWLLFLDVCGIGADLADVLRSKGHEVVTVIRGPGFERVGSEAFRLSPANPSHYSDLLEQLHALGKTPDNIVHLWATTAKHHQSELEACEEVLDQTFYSLMFLAQSLGLQHAKTQMHLYIISNDLHDISGDPVFAPMRATLLGPCKTIPNEYRNITAQNIDIHIPDNPQGRSEVIEDLLAEFGSGEDDLIAYRGGYRWRQIFDSFPVKAPALDRQNLRQGGVYLITGGYGGIGLVIAQHLACTMQAKLVLIGRTSLPQRDQWPQWLAEHPIDDEISGRIRMLHNLENAGAEVLALHSDVTDLPRMQEVVNEALERFGAIHGVIHAAGVAGDGIMELKTREVASRVLAPKVKGTLVLEEVLKDTKLDFLILCSSLASILPSMGQVDYIAANAFLDAYSYSRRGEATTSPVSVNWDRWDETGMAVARASPQRPLGGISERRRKAMKHPIFSACATHETGESYIFQLSPADCWLIGEHWVNGTHTLVGTAYLELARAAFAIRSTGPVELRDVLFAQPLMLKPDESCEIHVELKPQGESCEFMIHSTQDGKSWLIHAMGTVHKAGSAPSQRAENLRARKQCNRPLELGNGEGTSRPAMQELVQLGPRWKNLQSAGAGSDQRESAKIGDSEGVAFLQLPKEFVADLAIFPLHPALMDQAASWAMDMLQLDDYYLPFSYKRIRINNVLPPLLYSYAKIKTVSDEFVTIDLLLSDIEGESLVEIDAFELKRVRGHLATGALTAPQHSAPDVPANVNERGQGEPWGDHILSKEGVEVFERIVGMNPVPQIMIATKDLSYLLWKARTKESREEHENRDFANIVAAHPRPELSTPYVSPRTELEETITKIWEAVLGVEGIGVDDNFVELGGNSLIAIQLAARTREVFEVALSVPNLYAAPTVAGLAGAIVELLVAEADSQTVEEGLRAIDTQLEGSIAAEPS